jgi:hypothetical protein
MGYIQSWKPIIRVKVATSKKLSEREPILIAISSPLWKHRPEITEKDAIITSETIRPSRIRKKASKCLRFKFIGKSLERNPRIPRSLLAIQQIPERGLASMKRT